VIVVLVVLQMQFVRSAEVYYYGLLMFEVQMFNQRIVTISMIMNTLYSH
jgi:hypothetical protein